ncbi:hypothetical protein ANCDUO_07188 [Ancylostoma duodenale]|uniref:Uncharacterized protein n=1 Tax=Ancylostoma duodenale TaxID=51022 RepID=A0A0C2CZP3_9BILA|nr:hypothetical protein ANCDUO_07188 [Ancylostoma duodenale]
MSRQRSDISDNDNRGMRRRRQHSEDARSLPRPPRISAGADQRTVSQLIGVNLPPPIDDKLTEIYRKVVDLSPIPNTFDYGHMFESYVWRAIFLTSFTIGIRFGNLDVISCMFMAIFGIYIIFLFTYIVLPIGIIYGNQIKKVSTINSLYVQEAKRIILIGISATLGMLSSVVNQHYVVVDTAAPSYFLPGLVGLAVQVVGPQFAQDRVKFLAVSVGSAFTIGVLLMAIFHDLSFAALFGLIISAICATINLQIMVYAINHGKKMQKY